MGPDAAVKSAPHQMLPASQNLGALPEAKQRVGFHEAAPCVTLGKELMEANLSEGRRGWL